MLKSQQISFLLGTSPIHRSGPQWSYQCCYTAPSQTHPKFDPGLTPDHVGSLKVLLPDIWNFKGLSWVLLRTGILREDSNLYPQDCPWSHFTCKLIFQLLPLCKLSQYPSRKSLLCTSRLGLVSTAHTQRTWANAVMGKGTKKACWALRPATALAVCYSTSHALFSNTFVFPHQWSRPTLVRVHWSVDGTVRHRNGRGNSFWQWQIVQAKPCM